MKLLLEYILHTFKEEKCYVKPFLGNLKRSKDCPILKKQFQNWQMSDKNNLKISRNPLIKPIRSQSKNLRWSFFLKENYSQYVVGKFVPDKKIKIKIKTK